MAEHAEQRDISPEQAPESPEQVSESQIAVHWREVEYYYPPDAFVRQANACSHGRITAPLDFVINSNRSMDSPMKCSGASPGLSMPSIPKKCEG